MKNKAPSRKLCCSCKWLNRTLLFTVFKTTPHGSVYSCVIHVYSTKLYFRARICKAPYSYTTVTTKTSQKNIVFKNAYEPWYLLSVINLLSDRWRNIQSFARRSNNVLSIVACPCKQHGQSRINILIYKYILQLFFTFSHSHQSATNEWSL